MKKMRKILSHLLAASMVVAVALPVSAMPGDIEEAVTSGGYNAYEHVGGSSYYEEADLLSIDGKYVATANAMIRQAPFGEILGSVTPGETYHVVGECPDCMWYKISGSETGYVYASYLVPESEYRRETNSNSEVGKNIKSLDMLMTIDGAANVNVRTAPSRNGSVVAVAKEGEEIHVTGNVLGTEWYQCEYDGETVYICDDYLKPEFPQTMACTVRTTLNVHDGADVNANIIGILKHGDKIKASAVENDFLRFSLDDGRIGYVSDEYMAVVE